MSKYVKQLITDHLREQLQGVDYALVVDVVGLDAVRTTNLRKTLRDKSIEICVVKNSLARRATEGTALAPAFEGLVGSSAVVWGSSDVVALAKEIIRLTEDKQFEGFQARAGVLDGARLNADEVKAVSKWPSREEQLSILLGQILSPGGTLSAQLLGPGGGLASQIKQRGEEEGAQPEESTAA